MQILTPVLVLGAMGLIFGIGLALASKVFEVKQDERVPRVRAELPGANCGGCGYPGCDALAEAIVKGEAPLNACPVGGAAVAAKVGEIMGQEVESGARKAARIMCHGTHDVAPQRAQYFGVNDCREALNANGGTKSCRYGCLGYGSCVAACPFDALTLGEDGIPKVDEDKCTACGVCVATCPKSVIDLVPVDKQVTVSCSNHDKGKFVKGVCKTGCIACHMCERVCPTGAVKVVEDVAVIDYDKCISCGLCEEKCPANAITGQKTEGALEAWQKEHPEWEPPKPRAPRKPKAAAAAAAK